jgi:hypothetical protein
MTDDDIERGAAEDNSGVPVTPTDVDASRVPPSQGGGHADELPDEDRQDDETPPGRR